jgi:hypothetical protein
MYLPTLVSPMSMPSFSSSPWMRGAPHVGFSRLILRISSRTSVEILRLGLAVTNSPRPEKSKAPSVPCYDGLRLDDGEGGSPVAPDSA